MTDKTIIVENNKLRLRIAELEAENSKLRERCHPSKVVMIGDTGHYVSEAVATEIARLTTRMAELEAERDRLKAALTQLDDGPWLGLDAHEIIRAALSDPSGEKA